MPTRWPGYEWRGSPDNLIVVSWDRAHVTERPYEEL